MGLTKAKLEIEKEFGLSIIDVLFNPSEYQLTDGANYSEKKYQGWTGQSFSIFLERLQNFL